MAEVVVVTEGPVRWITLNRPAARNALTQEVVRTATKAFEEASSDASVRVVVLRGAEGHFCAGADLRKSFEDDPNFLDHLEAYMAEYHALIRSIVRCSKPTIAMLDGAAVGFGADLAWACDLRVASTRAYVEERFVKIGLMPDGGGTFWLPRLVGTARALQLMLLADRLDGAALAQAGLVQSVVDPEGLEAAVRALAGRLALGPPLALAAIKRSVYASWGDLEEALRRERHEQLQLLRSADAAEGIAAFLQKRAPVFTGK